MWSHRRKLPIPCGNLSEEILVQHAHPEDESIQEHPFRRGFFDCGEYFFDGTFNVVRFPEGMTLYHGGGRVADNVVQFPVGPSFYSPQPGAEGGAFPENDAMQAEYITIVTTDDESIEEIVSRVIKVTPGWYGTPETARSYSNQSPVPLGRGPDPKNPGADKCDGKCILAYKLTQPVVLFLLDDNYNIYKLLTDNRIPVTDEFRRNLRSMFDIDPQSAVGFGGDVAMPSVPGFREKSEGPFTRFGLANKDRTSYRNWDGPFARDFCWETKDSSAALFFSGLGYAGYGATRQQTHPDNISHRGGTFHAEVVFCNAFAYLKRNIDDPHDWQFNPIRGNVGHDGTPESRSRVVGLNNQQIVTTEKFLRQMALYKAVDVNRQSGDLLRQSTWALLWAEDNMIKEEHARTTLDSSGCPDGFQKATAFAAFIHAVGKMNPGQCTPNLLTSSLICGEMTNYAQNGAQYFLTGVPAVGDNLQSASIFDLKDIAKTFGVDLAFLPWIKSAVEHQGVFLDQLKKVLRGEPLHTAVAEYVRLLGDVSDRKCWVIMLLIVSISSIQAAQPFGVGRISYLNPGQSLNASSVFFPWIANLSKTSRGRDSAKTLDLYNVGLDLAREIMLRIRTGGGGAGGGAGAGGGGAGSGGAGSGGAGSGGAGSGGAIHVYTSTLRALIQLAFDTAIVSFDPTGKTLGAIDLGLQTVEPEAYNISAKSGDKEIVSFPGIAHRAGIGMDKDQYRQLETFWEINLALFYEPYMQDIAEDLSHLPGMDLETLEKAPLHTRIDLILRELAPVLNIVYNRYSGKPYPNFKVTPPRYNHNSLNHLRSVFFCAQVLLTTTFIDEHHLNNTEIFTILLYSFLKSIGRVNERSGSLGPIQYNPEKYAALFPGQIAPQAPNLELYETPSFTSVSSVIQYQILASIKDKFGLTASRLYNNSVYDLVVSPYSPNFIDFKSDNGTLRTLLNMGAAIAVGHYLDHCRPTTGFSQLDSEDADKQKENDFGTGQPWVTTFLRTNRNKEKFPNWFDYKNFLYQKQNAILLATGYEPSGNDDISIELSSGRRCRAAFSGKFTEAFVTLSYDFDKTWKILLGQLEAM